ncbi:MAG: hypothetical protein GC150_00900 [Rhizobiales bacterium]|nr:hypothetical protein [Hyphomicrobiales bacterium]
MCRSETIEAIGAARRSFCEAAAQYHGRIVEMTGDSVLAVFNTSQAAMRAALSVQHALSRGHGEGDGRALRFRIAICEGETTEGEGGLFGEVIIKAARLQSLTAPGCIGVDEDVFQALAPSLRVFEPRRIGGVAKAGSMPIRGIEIDPAAISTGCPPPVPRGAGSRLRAVTAVEVLVAGTTDDEVRDVLAGRVVDHLVGAAFDVTARQVQRGLRNLLSRMARDGAGCGDYLVLIEGEPGFGRSVKLGIYSRQQRRFLLSRHFGCLEFGHGRGHNVAGAPGGASVDTVASYVVDTIEVGEIEASDNQVLSPRGSFHHYLKGKRLLSTYSRIGILEGIRALREALHFDPDYARAHALLARGYAIAWRFDWACGPAQPLETAIEHASRAVQIDPIDPVCEHQLGFCHFWSGERDRAVYALERARRMRPGCAGVAGDLGMVFSYLDRCDEAIDLLQASLALDETNPDYRLWSLGDAHFERGDDEAVLRVLSRMRDPTQSYRLLAAATARLGGDPRRHVDRLLRYQPDFSVERWIAVQPTMTEEGKTVYAEALRAAGLPG